MRVKQTARKSTGPRQENDPMRRRQQVLETKRSSLGRNASAYIQGRNSSTSGQNLPPSNRPIGNHGRGKQLPDKEGVKKRPRQKNGANALKEIKRFQQSTDLLIPKAPFHRVIREITQALDTDGELRYQYAAILALQEAAEAYMVRLFEDAYMLTIHARRVTLFTKDIELCRRLRREC